MCCLFMTFFKLIRKIWIKKNYPKKYKEIIKEEEEKNLVDFEKISLDVDYYL